MNRPDIRSPDIRSLDIGMLRTFDALMRERSVSRAAARLFLSQPAVSASLRRLRETFGDPLFIRKSHGVLPSPRALALAPQVAQVLADIARMLDGDQAFDPATSNRIFRVAGADHASQLVLPALGRLLADCGSSVRIYWELLGTWSLIDRLNQGDLDLALVGRLKLPSDLAYEEVYADHYVYALRADHPRAHEPATLARFCEVPQVFLGYGTQVLDDLIDQHLARSGLRRQAQLAVNSFGQIVHQLQHSDHAAVLPARVAQFHAEGPGAALSLQPLPFDLPGYHFLVAWHPGHASDPGLSWLKQQLLQILAPLAACPPAVPD